jgi:hypothetical protein
MNTRPAALIILAGLAMAASAQQAFAQSSVVVNPGFETPLNVATQNRARDWRHFNTARRRIATDGLMPPALIRTGIASMEVTAGFDFGGMDTDTFNSGTLLWNNPEYFPGCGPITWTVWVNIPASHPFVSQSGGLKWEFKRSDTSVYEVFEDRFFGPGTAIPAHTNGQWVQISSTVTQADFDWKFNFYNDGPNQDGLGDPWPLPPDAVSLVHFRFGTPPMGVTETGTVFFDDVACAQVPFVAGDPVEFWDDTFMKAIAVADGGVLEPAVPLYLNGSRIGYPCLAGDDSFKIVNVFDSVPGTSSFPLTWADIVANGYVRPLVQKSDGTSQIGTSVITAPSFKASGQPLDLIPVITRADVAARLSIPPDRDLNQMPPFFGTPLRSENFTITGQGNYGPPATVVSVRDYGVDPVVGDTSFEFTFTWTATQNITLDASPTGRGFDALRLMTLSSMLANVGLGQYDARFIAVKSPLGDTRTLAIPDAPRGVYLYAAPQPIAVGGTLTLFQDNGGTFNPGSPSLEVTLQSISGAAGALGVQAFLASSTDPNDDSLNAWIEWVGAPAVIPSGTVITATFLVRATAPTDVGDANHDGVRDCADVDILNSLLGATTSAANFNAYVDMNGDGTITAADRALLEAITGPCATPPCAGDADGSGMVNFDDINSVIANWLANYAPGTGPGDANQDGVVNFDDINAVIANWLSDCT